MAHRDLREWSPAALILLPAVLGWILPLATSSVHITGFWWLPLLVVSILLVAVIIFVARPMSSLSASSDQLETRIASLGGLAETYSSKLGPDAQETIRVRQDLDVARQRLATIQRRQAKERAAAGNNLKGNGVTDRPTMILLGIIAITLPIVLIVGHALATQSFRLPASLSYYYFSDMRNFLVGGLFSMGVLFVRARGGSLEVKFTTVAGVLAIVAALAPVTPAPLLGHTSPPEEGILIGEIHLASISALEMLTAVLCLIVFPWAGRGNKLTRLGVTSGQICRLCGIIILCDIAAGTFSNFLPVSVEDGSMHPLLWCDVMWLLVFGFACIVRSNVAQPRQSSPPS